MFVRYVNRFCEDCYEKYKEKHKLSDKRERILVAGQGVVKQTLEHGDETHYPDVFDKVSILYEMRILGKTAVVDSTAMRGGRPIWFESGCSGPCLHVQVLCANRVYQASVLDVNRVQCRKLNTGTSLIACARFRTRIAPYIGRTPLLGRHK